MKRWDMILPNTREALKFNGLAPYFKDAPSLGSPRYFVTILVSILLAAGLSRRTDGCG